MKKTFNWPLALALSLALVHGVMYVFLLPPWQHYDEPAHFENVWLWASTGRAPQTDTPDLIFRRELVESMIANHFYKGAVPPDLEQVAAGGRIYGLEYSQLNEPPLYYAFAALPVHFLQDRNPAVMLIAARMMSVGLFVFTVFAIWGLTRELTGTGSALRVWVPMSAALLPGFVDVMTAVNNDVGAIAAVTFFLWGSLFFLNRPSNLWAVVWVLASALLCLGTKSSAFVAAPLGMLVLMLGWIRGRVGRWIWGFGLFAGILGGLFLLTWQEPAYWARATSQTPPTRLSTETAPLGTNVVQLDPSSPTTPEYLSPLQQLLPLPKKNVPLTFGVWMWLDGPGGTVTAHTPVLRTEHQTFFETLSLTTTPTFYAFEVILPPETSRLWISLEPAISGDASVIYYDAFILTEGQYPLDMPPVFETSDGKRGTWDGVPFQNIIRNPSVEQAWPAFQPALDNQLAKVVPDNARPSTLLFGIFDWTQTRAYFGLTAQHLFETFWARFAWGHVPLAFPLVYTVLKIFCFISMGGVIWRWKSFLHSKFIFLFVAMLLIWGATFLRGEIFLFTTVFFVPVARYAFPAVAPTLFFLWAGWRAWGILINQLFMERSVDLHRFAHIIAALCCLSLAVVSIYSVFLFYERI